VRHRLYRRGCLPSWSGWYSLVNLIMDAASDLINPLERERVISLYVLIGMLLKVLGGLN